MLGGSSIGHEDLRSTLARSWANLAVRADTVRNK